MIRLKSQSFHSLDERMLTGVMAISRRPKPCRSGREGCAPIDTPFCLAARRTVAFITVKSLPHDHDEDGERGRRTGTVLKRDARGVEAACDVGEVHRLDQGRVVALHGERTVSVAAGCASG